MGIPAELNNVAEQVEYLHARIAYIEELLSGIYPSFPTDMDALCAKEIETSSLNAASKTKVNTAVTDGKTKLKKK
jgi:hypothetical protein